MPASAVDSVARVPEKNQDPLGTRHQIRRQALGCILEKHLVHHPLGARWSWGAGGLGSTAASTTASHRVTLAAAYRFNVSERTHSSLGIPPVIPLERHTGRQLGVFSVWREGRRQLRTTRNKRPHVPNRLLRTPFQGNIFPLDASMSSSRLHERVGTGEGLEWLDIIRCPPYIRSCPSHAPSHSTCVTM